MIPKINIELDEKAVREHLEKRLDEIANQQLWLVDVKRLSQLTCMSIRHLEEEILHHPKMRMIEIRKNRKRWWPAEQAFKAIMEITSEW